MKRKSRVDVKSMRMRAKAMVQLVAKSQAMAAIPRTVMSRFERPNCCQATAVTAASRA